MIDYIFRRTNEYLEHMPKALRKKYGQFFTSPETAMYMAEMLTIPQQRSLSILDPGAGSGILSAALIEVLQKIPSLENIELICYENDLNILELLRSNIEWISTHSTKKITYQIIPQNYIISQSADYNFMPNTSQHSKKYDLIISNPPYMKMSKDAPEALAMQDVCYGAPNIYFLFATMSLFNLRDDGEMVYVIPRSWTSGAYFKKFRQKLLTLGALGHIHLFISRDKIFESDSILQETMIITVKKTTTKPDSITISTTNCARDFASRTVFKAPYSTVVSGDESYVYLITNKNEASILKKINKFPETLPSLGLKMKTGVTVDFRNRSILRNDTEENAVPLFYSNHIQNGKIIFPLGKSYEYIVTEKNGLKQKNTNYLFVKRFTSKEEHRRLQCGVYLAKKYPEYNEISTQNKINFICGMHSLSECIVYGLYVLFNSTFYDSYYRILNGSTQVNSTEINTIPVPSIDIIETMGKELIHSKDMSEDACDSILRRYI